MSEPLSSDKPTRYYRPELDALRFFAFLSVFTVHRMDHLPIDAARHFWFYNICLLGNFGVPVFFCSVPSSSPSCSCVKMTA
jgi:peptidoglycan/LPS O-acetylase OafA/YrhL